MKVRIASDEWWPVYEIITPDHEYYREDLAQEVDDDLVQRYKAAYKEFRRVQELLCGFLEDQR